jgi:hypothetical protein
MSRWETIAEAIVSAINEAIELGNFTKPPRAEIAFEVSEQLEVTNGFRKIFILPSAPHSAIETGVAPTSEHQIGIYMILIYKLTEETKIAQTWELLDLLQSLYAVIRGINLDDFRHSGSAGDEPYDPIKWRELGVFWSESLLTFVNAYDG